MAGFVAGSLSRHVKPLPLACALAVGGFAWRCLAKPRTTAKPARPVEPLIFTSEEEFLRQFQAEAALERQSEARACQPMEPAAQLPTEEPLPLVPLRTEEDFLRLFETEMKAAPLPQIEEPPVKVSAEAAPRPAPIPEPEPAVALPGLGEAEFAIEQALAAEAEMSHEEVMGRNAAWLLGLEPLPVIQLEDAPLRAEPMAAAIPDRIEIQNPPAHEGLSSELAVSSWPSSQGGMTHLLEREPGTILSDEWVTTPLTAANPESLAPGVEVREKPAGAELVGVKPEPEHESFAWLPNDVIPKNEPPLPVIKPRLILPRAPVAVAVDDDAKGWLNWWK